MLLTSGLALAQPTIVSVVPGANQLNVPRNSPVVASFSQALSSGSAAALRLFSAQRGGLRSATSGSTTVTGSQVSFRPTYDWKPGETVRGTVTGAAQNGAGQALAGSRVFEFTTATAGTGLGSFVQGNPLTAGAYPVRIGLADVDGDGDLDMVSANNTAYGSARAPVSIRLNNGLGQFGGGSDVRVATSPQGVSKLAIGDVDGDGTLDLVTANTLDSVSIRFNNGAGGFSTGSDLFISGGYRISDVGLADLDGDGDLDLAVVGNNQPAATGNLSVRFNDGTGRFVAGYTRALGTTFGAAVFKFADVDNDGALDLIRSSYLSTSLYVHLNPNGTGVFNSTATAQVPVQGVIADLETGDLDGDGDLDLLALDNDRGKLYVYVNTGGNFSLASLIFANYNPGKLSLGDIDADGDLDLLVNGGYAVSCYFNNGRGGFPGYYRLPVTSLDTYALGDIDGDNDLDVVAAYHPSSPPGPASPVYTFLNQPTAPVLVLGTPTSGAPAVALYPNPARQQCTVLLPKAYSKATVTLLNALGQPVKTVQVTGRTSVSLDVRDLPPSVYTVVLHADTETSARRLVVN